MAGILKAAAPQQRRRRPSTTHPHAMRSTEVCSTKLSSSSPSRPTIRQSLLAASKRKVMSFLPTLPFVVAIIVCFCCSGWSTIPSHNVRAFILNPPISSSTFNSCSNSYSRLRLRRKAQPTHSVLHRSRSSSRKNRGTWCDLAATPDDRLEGDEDIELAPLFVDRTKTNGSSKHNANDSKYDQDDALAESFRRVRSSILTSSIDEKDGSVHNNSSEMGADEIKRINLAIVKQGQKFAMMEDSSKLISAEDGGDGGEAHLISDAERVPGCVATVHVRTMLVPLESTNGIADKTYSDPSQYKVLLEGDADALLSRGLLALLSDAFSGGGDTIDCTQSSTVTAQDVLNLDPNSVADMLGLRSVLSTGRNDGLASMTKVVQDQIRRLSLHCQEDESVTVNSASATNFSVQTSATASNFSNTAVSNGTKRPTVAMLLSGGVDSSVALNLLVREGYDVTAFYLKIWLEDELSHLGQCPWEDDYSVCQAVCEQAGVPLETVSLQKEYKDRVISYTIEEARRGRTPNPDIMCNSRVKFGCFYDAIAGRGFEYVASGHYAQLQEVETDDGEKTMKLLRAPDPVKDQTYFLCALTQEQLSKVKFPIGSYQKSEVRDLAQKFELPNRNRPDSQGLCFLGKVKFDEFINAYLGTNPGDIEDASTGRVIGRHNGLWYHTVGQRKGIGKVLNPIESSRGPWYIVAKDRDRNVVIASNQYADAAFDEARTDCYVEDITWVAGSPSSQLVDSADGSEKRWKDGRFTMKIRHGPTMVNGTLSLDEDLIDGSGGSVRLDIKDKGLAPGQYCVFYNLDDEECVGAGVISESHWHTLLGDMKEAEVKATET